MSKIRKLNELSRLNGRKTNIYIIDTDSTDEDTIVKYMLGRYSPLDRNIVPYAKRYEPGSDGYYILSKSCNNSGYMFTIVDYGTGDNDGENK